MLQCRAQLAAENLFLRKQLACYVERQARPHRTDNASRIAFVLLSSFIDWRQLLGRGPSVDVPTSVEDGGEGTTSERAL